MEPLVRRVVTDRLDLLARLAATVWMAALVRRDRKARQARRATRARLDLLGL